MTQRLTSKNLYVTVTCISWSSDFALYLEDCLMFEHYTYSSATFDQKKNVGHSVGYLFFHSDFALYPK